MIKLDKDGRLYISSEHDVEKNLIIDGIPEEKKHWIIVDVTVKLQKGMIGDGTQHHPFMISGSSVGDVVDYFRRIYDNDGSKLHYITEFIGCRDMNELKAIADGEVNQARILSGDLKTKVLYISDHEIRKMNIGLYVSSKK